MLGDFVTSLQEFITKKIINNLFKSIMARSTSIFPTSLKDESKRKSSSSSSVVVSLISILGFLSSLLLLYIPSKIGIVGFSTYAQLQQQLPQSLQLQQNSLDQLSSSLQIAQSKVQAATAPGACGHGVPSA